MPPLQGTLVTVVVNIRDYLMRLTNDRFVSMYAGSWAEHRAVDRLSMPFFFFGCNVNETVAGLPSCVDEGNPPKYKPISCDDVS